MQQERVIVTTLKVVILKVLLTLFLEHQRPYLKSALFIVKAIRILLLPVHHLMYHLDLYLCHAK